MEITVTLTEAEMQALKKAFPDADPSQAASMLLKAEMKHRYKRQQKTAQFLKMRDLKSPAV